MQKDIISTRGVNKKFLTPKGKKIIDEWVESSRKVVISKEEIAAIKMSVKRSLIRAGYSVREAKAILNGKNINY